MADSRAVSNRPIITLTTDFGTTDTFVAQMKGVILSIHPGVEIVDLTHHVPPQDVAAASFLLATAVDVFPRGTIHVVVVDPGVGTGRRAIAVRTDRHVYVAPDNGVLTGVLEMEPAMDAYVISEGHYTRERVSNTFHGRDIFAPVAAWIARGTELSNLGPLAENLERLPRTKHDLTPGEAVEVRVLHVDRFGNVVLDLRESDLRPHLETGLAPAIAAGTAMVTRLCRTFAEAGGDGPVLIFGSTGHLEIVIDRDRAADRLGLAPGATVELRLSRGSAVL